MKLDKESYEYLSNIEWSFGFIFGSYLVNESILFGYPEEYPPSGKDFKIRFKLKMKTK